MPDHQLALDSWRGLAAVFVDLHYLVSTDTSTGNELIQNNWLLIKHLLLISSFIIATNDHPNIKSGGDLKNVMFPRLPRLWPPHIAMLALWVIFELAIAVLIKWAATGGRAAFAEPYDLNSLASKILLIQSLGLNEQSRIWVAWNISTGVWTYLVFATFLLVAVRRAERAFAVGDISGVGGAAFSEIAHSNERNSKAAILGAHHRLSRRRCILHALTHHEERGLIALTALVRSFESPKNSLRF